MSLVLPRRLSTALPRGGHLDDVRWESHHRLLRWVLGLHLPVLGAAVLLAWPTLGAADGPVTGLGASTGQSAGVILLLLATAALLLARHPAGHAARSVAVAVGLLVCSTLLVLVTGGLGEAHFHYFVMLGFVLLYHDWRPFLAAFGVAAAGHGALATVAPAVTGADTGWATQGWGWVTAHVGFLALAAAGQVALWRVSEDGQERAGRYYAELYGGERALISRLHEAERVKSELLALASHELRTPLTGIIGAARTLDRRLDDLDLGQVRTLLSHIDVHARRLTRLVDNLMASAASPEASAGASTDLGALVATVVAAARNLPVARDHDIRLDVDGAVVAMIDERAARRVVSNLLDNALKFADPASDVGVVVRRDGDMVVLEVDNAGPGLPEAVRLRLGEPFAQGDSSDARRAEGMGLGLHVIRSLVRTHDGIVELEEGGGRVRFRVLLHALRPAPTHQPRPSVAI